MKKKSAFQKLDLFHFQLWVRRPTVLGPSLWTMISVLIVAIMHINNNLCSHCYNNAFQTMISVPIIAEVFQQWPRFLFFATLWSNRGSVLIFSIVFQQWSQFPVFQQFILTIIWFPIAATMFLVPVVETLCYNNVITVTLFLIVRFPLFPLFIQCVPTIISVLVVATSSNNVLDSLCCNSVF